MEEPRNPFTRAFVANAIWWILAFVLLLSIVRRGGFESYIAATGCVAVVIWGAWNFIKAAR